MVRVVRRGPEDGPPTAHFLLLVQVSRQFDKQGIIDLLEPVVEALGFELVDVDVRFGRNGLLRLYIDRPGGASAAQIAAAKSAEEPSQGGITLGDCELVSGQVGAFLDVEDPLPGSYTLEVSSPGLDRKLRTRAHFERFAGSEIRVELAHAIGNRRRFRGRLAGIEGEEIVIDADGEALRLRLDDIAEARLVPDA